MTERSFFPSVASSRILNKVSLPYQVLQLFSGHCRLVCFSLAKQLPAQIQMQPDSMLRPVSRWWRRDSWTPPIQVQSVWSWTESPQVHRLPEWHHLASTSCGVYWVPAAPQRTSEIHHPDQETRCRLNPSVRRSLWLTRVCIMFWLPKCPVSNPLPPVPFAWNDRPTSCSFCVGVLYFILFCFFVFCFLFLKSAITQKSLII